MYRTEFYLEFIFNICSEIMHFLQVVYQSVLPYIRNVFY